MKLKRIVAAIAAAAVAVSTMAMTAFAGQDAAALADGTAYLNINTPDWAAFDAEWTNAEITGDGTYTVAMKGAPGITVGQFNALEIKNGETLFNRTYTVTVDSIKIDGTEAKIAEGYTCSADGACITTRVNLYNEWNDPSEEVSDDGFVDNRAADGDVMSKSARMIEAGYEGVSDIEVTFTVSGIGGAAAAAETTEEAAPAADEAPAADTTTTATATGNTSAAVIVSLMAVAGVAAIASSKRK